jgi:poly(hydroxyalkanoate) depolymerase family esterase
MKMPLKNLAPFLSTIALASLAAIGCAAAPTAQVDPTGTTSAAVSTTLTPVTTFGSNPGSLLMYSYAPTGLASNAPLVLALHGCTQVATDFENTGWNQLADIYGFYLVYPQQQSANNTESCFNWFGNTSGSTADITRGQGEGESIIQMIDYMKTTYSIDASRIYIAGFSAGAAYTVAMLAMYPDVFAGGASFSGIPYGCASSLISAYSCMDGPTTNTSAQWGTLAKAGDPGFTGTYPRLSVWQGSADTTVNTANLAQIVSQWTSVTGVSDTPTTTNTVGGFPHNVYANSAGVAQVESYSITGMSHAVPIDVAEGCGTADTYAVEEGVCGAALAIQFWGLQPVEDAGALGASSGGSGSGSGGSGSGGSGSGGGIGNGSGSGGSSSGGLGASSGTTTGASSGTGTSSGGATAAAAPATLPGCSAAPGRHAGSDGVFVVMALGMIFVARRRSRATRVAVAASAVASIVLTTAHARAADNHNDDIVLDDAPSKPANADTHLPKPAYLGPQGAFYTGAAVSSTPAVLFGYFPVDHFATTVGLGFTYNGNGSPTSPLTGVKGAPNNRVGSDVMLDFIYFVHDRAPFAMGPELTFITSLSPNVPFTEVVVTPMWALRYSPWKAPIAIGTGLGMSLAFTKGAQPVASLYTQGLDIVYAF